MAIKICMVCGDLISEDEIECKHCKYYNRKSTDLVKIDADPTIGEYLRICKISNDPLFIKAMLELRGTDIIEYTTKMKQLSQQANTPRCPKCGSTNITTGARGINAFWGPIGASKTVNRCAKCGYTWKP